MMTPCPNLIPRQRLAARRVAARLRLWLGVVAGCALLIAGAFAAIRAGLGDPARNIEADLARTTAEATQAQDDLRRDRAELADAARLHAAAKEVQDHPDFSALLGAIARMRGEDVVLGSLELLPESVEKQKVSATRPARYSLRLSGLARDHRAATAFSLMLEGTHVFSRVTLTDTTSQNVGDHAVVAFGVECALDETGGGNP